MIEAHPPGTEVDQCKADELSRLAADASVGYQPRKLVDRCADEFAKALTAASTEPDPADVPVWMLSVLYDNLIAACNAATDAMLIIESHGADKPWAAWLSVNLKFAKAGKQEIWSVLDDMHKPNLSSDPQDQQAHNRALDLTSGPPLDAPSSHSHPTP